MSASDVISKIPIIDTMMGIPDPADNYDYFAPLLMGEHAKDVLGLPQGYLYTQPPSIPAGSDPAHHVLSEMDRHGIVQSVIDIGRAGSNADRALHEHPGRFVGTFTVNPNAGMAGVRELEAAVKQRGARAAFVKPSMLLPQVPIDDRRLYPIYAKCVELDIPIFILTGVPGPRVPLAPQKVELLDEVCYFFPELRIVMRHCGEPWEELAIKLMLKWPNLYYSTSAFSPKFYPESIIRYANSRGAHKIIYAGYFPFGLSLDRIMSELSNLPLKNEVWPQFLRGNAAVVLKLEQAS
jgi:predicted TIM-barrel fold metal-dependent hydrolase